MKSWQENILFVDGIVGVMLGIISTSISSFFITNSDLLVSWLAVCAVVIAVPVVWWMPFISQESAEERAIKAVTDKNPAVTDLRVHSPFTTALRRWKWHVRVDGRMGQDNKAYRVVISAKCGNVESIIPF